MPTPRDKIDLIQQPFAQTSLGKVLKKLLGDGRWDEFRAAIAFVKRSGVKHIASELESFSHKGKVAIVAGVDLHGTSYEGLSDLLDVLGDTGPVFIRHNENSASTFHPKVYMFKNRRKAVCIVGSGNLTEGGLYSNCEASMYAELDLSVAANREFVGAVTRSTQGPEDENELSCRRLTREFLDELLAGGYVLREAQLRGWTATEGRTTSGGRRGPLDRTALFSHRAVPAPPRRIARPTTRRPGRPGSRPHEIVTEEALSLRGFVMTLQRTDVGVGQTTSGTSRRSPEVFIPLVARDHAPAFWGYPDQFTLAEDKDDRHGVRMRMGGEVFSVNMMNWHEKHDFRLRSEHLRSAGSVGDILRVDVSDDASIDYEVEVIHQGTDKYEQWIGLCSHPVRNSRKRFGYYV